MKRLITLLLPVLSIFLFLLTGEIVVRVYHFIRFDISLLDGQPRASKTGTNLLSPITLDNTFGWRATENFRFDGIKHNSDGTEYRSRVSQDGRGFRMFGDPLSGKPRIFVIGDSFTQAVDASDDKTYYATLKKLLDAEVFAYGVGGWGSLQELMILDKYIDEIRPDFILWQYSVNDIINNSPDLERASTSNNNGMIRPYLISDHVRYILPARDAAGLRQFALQYCRICYMTLNRIDRLRAATQESVETQTAPDKAAHAQFVEALQTTDEVMKRVRKRAGSIPIVAFITGDPERTEYWEGLEEISRHHDIVILTDVNAAVKRAEKRGTVVTGFDHTHWNDAGHQIAGEAIAAGLRDSSVKHLLTPHSREAVPSSRRIPFENVPKRETAAAQDDFAYR
jgi:lysophospholipase L1-like esterase